MKKTLFSLLILTVITLSTSSAQKISERPASWDKQLCLTIGGNFITGSEADNFNPGIGLDGIFYYRIGEQTFLSAGIGFHILNVKEEKLQAFLGQVMPVGMTAEVGYFALPLSVGIRHNFTTKGFQPYIGAEIGATVLGTSIKMSYLGKTNDTTTTDTYLSFMPKVGFRLPLAPYLDFDGHLKYNHIFAKDEPFGIITLNVGIAYTIK